MFIKSVALLFAPFFAGLIGLSWSSYSTMPFERPIKPAKESIKNQLPLTL
jgi:hypothetical protein